MTNDDYNILSNIGV